MKTLSIILASLILLVFSVIGTSLTDTNSNIDLNGIAKKKTVSKEQNDTTKDIHEIFLTDTIRRDFVPSPGWKKYSVIQIYGSISVVAVQDTVNSMYTFSNDSSISGINSMITREGVLSITGDLNTTLFIHHTGINSIMLGSGVYFVHNTRIISNKLTIILSSGSFACFDIDVQTLKAYVLKKSTLQIYGKTNSAEVSLMDTSRYEASLLDAKNTRISIESSFSSMSIIDTVWINSKTTPIIPGINIKIDFLRRDPPGVYIVNNVQGSYRLPIFSQPSSNIPQFPIPPPKPTAARDISDLLRIENCSSLGVVADRIRNVLMECNYTDFSYFWIAKDNDINGFALLTRLEQEYNDGSIPENEFRYDFIHTAKCQRNSERFSFWDCFWNSNPGYYRSFAFIVTNNEFSVRNGKEYIINDLDALQSRGTNALPPEIRNREIRGMGYSCTVLVYEYEKQEHTSFATLYPKFPADHHLKKTGIWNKMLQNQ